MKKYLLTTASLLATCFLTAAPLQPDQLQLRSVIDFGGDLGAANSMFNPTYYDGFVYVNQINAGFQGFGRYPGGWGTPLMMKDNRGVTEHRMVVPFRGTNNLKYLIASSSGAPPTTTKFFRYDFDGSNVVDAVAPSGQIIEGFDWVDENTIIHTSYTSGNRKNLYLVHVTADPFSITADTRWNANGYVTTSVSTRIRNVRVGQTYRDYAYYGDNGQNANPKFYALDLKTGGQTELGDAGTLTGTGSFGVWTVLERGGYLYVQTTDNGIQVYPMTSATSVGPLLLTYTKESIDAIAGQATQYYGLDVVPDGSRFVLGAANGKVFEFGGPNLEIRKDGNTVFLVWPSSVTAVAVQSATSLAPGAFTDIDPQPYVLPDGKTNMVWVTATSDQAFFRLRKNP